MRAPVVLPKTSIKQAKWMAHSQKLILCQFYPDNPFWVVRPRFPGASSKPIEPLTPSDIAIHVNDPKALEGLSRWLEHQVKNPYGARAAWIQSLEPSLTSEARSKRSRALNHINYLWESLRMPHRLGCMLPEGLEIIIEQVKTIWVVEPIKDLSFFPGLWKRYDFDSHISYVRIR